MDLSKSTFELEKNLKEKGYEIIIGTDEVGRGPLAGPVVACAVALRNNQFPITDFQTNFNPPRVDERSSSRVEAGDQISNNKKILNTKYKKQNTDMWDLVRDSKTLSEKQREKAFDFILDHFHVGIGLCDHNTIDRINILEASFLSMKKAVQDLQRKIEKESRVAHDLKSKTIILVDGNKMIPNFSIEQKAIIGGDKTSKTISAASIIAKVTRDRMMLEFAVKYPQYGFEKHKGYGTKIHMDALENFGAIEIHRKSFAPVKKCC